MAAVLDFLDFGGGERGMLEELEVGMDLVEGFHTDDHGQVEGSNITKRHFDLAHAPVSCNGVPGLGDVLGDGELGIDVV